MFPGLKGHPFFTNYSVMVILNEKLIREKNLDIYRVIEGALAIRRIFSLVDRSTKPKGRVTVWPFFGPRWIWLKFEYMVV